MPEDTLRIPSNELALQKITQGKYRRPHGDDDPRVGLRPLWKTLNKIRTVVSELQLILKSKTNSGPGLLERCMHFCPSL